MTRWCSVALLLVAGCELEEGRGVRGSFDPPDNPPHDQIEDGFRHARGYEVPFLCKDPTRPGYSACPDDIRPLRENLSCDASGCHGDYSFTPSEPTEQRHLLGADGPSCWTCHDREWSDQRGGFSNGDD